MIVKMNQFCVYLHYHNSELLYVGCGRVDRAFSFCSRSKYWKSVFEGADEIEVKIHDYFKNRDDAITCEQELIRKYVPFCNICVPQSKRS